MGRTADGDLWEAVTGLLRRRPGWSLQAMASPGSPMVWCHAHERRVELTVTVVDGAISLHLIEGDEDRDGDLRFSEVGALGSWLAQNRPAAFGTQGTSVLDRLRQGRLFRWD